MTVRPGAFGRPEGPFAGRRWIVSDTVRSLIWAVVALAALSQAAAWGVSCASLGVAREAVRGGGR